MNLAKINQEWHQILRKAKCKEMKENVEHLRNWTERVMNLKRRTIDNLMVELDEAELQYSHNFQSHISHIQSIILKHQEDMDKMQEMYENDSKEICEMSMTELTEVKTKANESELHLKTVMFGLDKKLEEETKRYREKFMNDYDDVISSVSVYLLLQSVQKKLFRKKLLSLVEGQISNGPIPTIRSSFIRQASD